MRHHTGDYTAPDGQKLFTQRWLPDAAPRAIIVITHGIGEHSTRYARHAEFFTPHGYAVYTYDLRGHGQTPGPRGAVRSHDDLLSDLHAQVAAARADYPTTPIFVFGHSLGGNITLHYALKHPQGLTGVVASSPWLKLAFPPAPHLLLLAKLLKGIYPTLTLNAPLDNSAISRDPAIVRAYENDPLIHSKNSPGLGQGGIDAGKWILDHAAEFSLPVLLLHGTADRLTSPAATQQFYDTIASPTKKLIFYDGWYHELHHEPDHAQYFTDVLTWLDGIIA